MISFNRIPSRIDTNIFTIGGHSLLLMQLFHRLRLTFISKQTHSLLLIFFTTRLFLAMLSSFAKLSATHKISITSLGRHCISFEVGTNSSHYHKRMSHLFLIAKASFAQERIFLDEQIRFASKDNSNIYLIPHLYRITSTASCVSISRLCHAQ